MATKDSAGNLIREMSYIFDEAGDKGDQLEQTILRELESKGFPKKYTVQDDRIAGKRYRPIQIEVDSSYQIRIYHITVGKYLFARVYLYMPISFANSLAKTMGANQNNASASFGIAKLDLERDAIYSAILSICEVAFSKLNIKRLNNGYQSGQFGNQ